MKKILHWLARHAPATTINLTQQIFLEMSLSLQRHGMFYKKKKLIKCILISIHLPYFFFSLRLIKYYSYKYIKYVISRSYDLNTPKLGSEFLQSAVTNRDYWIAKAVTRRVNF